MREAFTALAAVLAGPVLAAAADAGPRESVAAAIQKLAEQPSYAWTTKVEAAGGGGPFGGGSVTKGQFEKDGYTWVASTDSGAIEFASRNGKAAVAIDGNWMTLEEASARGAGEGRGRFGLSRFDPAAVTEFPMPVRQLQELLSKAAGFKQEGETVTAELSAEAASELLAAGGRGPGARRGGRGGAGGGIREPRGSVSFVIDGGLLAQAVVSLSGSRQFRDAEVRIDRKSTTRFSEIGAVKAAVPPDAKAIIEALLEGKPSPVFVPEPGFKKLFNGRDLAGWAGRPEHWTVEDGAITGRTTRERPARGNNFLIARDGDKSLVVDDFELRLSYRILADNDRGFANSGIQYRSRELPDFVVAGYQADFEAGPRFSGILYDEGGGAGGRGIMAQRGESVVWNADGERSIAGKLGDATEIQARIKKDGWNDLVIVARGSRLQHFINGALTVEVVDDARGKRLDSGILALQLHAGEPMTVQIKDVRLKPLRTAELQGASALRVAKDFAIELLYTVPREREGSWVAMCLDPKGRLIVCDQNGGLHRVTLPPIEGGGAVRTERIDVGLGGAHGLLWAFDSLYVVVNERSPRGLYRVRDTDGDDRLDKVELLRELQGGGEHGFHSLVPSPDGKSLFLVAGNQTQLTKVDASRAPFHWGEDDLLPRLPTGFMDDSYAPQGWIARTDPDGKTWELIAIGFRNPYDIAFDKAGELFTYDADMEWDIGDPWYRPTRVNHVTSGAEFGFRNGNGKWPVFAIDSLGAVADVGPGSPTGIAFGYGARFPARYQDALFIADWSFGKLRAMHLKPDGASYTGEVEDFVSGQPFPITDFVVNPADGAIYAAVGGRGAQSALYRISYRGTESTAPSPPDLALQDRRDLRRSLERFHGRKDPAAVEAVWPYLGDADRAIRYAARVALEWQEAAPWRARALAEKEPRRAIAALVALARASGRDAIHRRAGDAPSDPALRDELLAALDRFAWPSLAHADRLDLLRAYWLAFTRLGRPDDAACAKLAARLDPLFPSKSRDLDVLLASLLIYLEAPNAAAKVVAALGGALTQEEQIEYAVALRALKTGWTMPLREEYFRWFVKAQSYRGGNTFASSLRRAKEQAAALLSDEEKAALRPILEARSERRSPQEVLASRPTVKEWTLEELAPIAERGLAGGRSFERGRKLYGEVACAACHRFANDGGAVGPDLSGVAGRFGVRDLLEAMVAPSKTISDQYEAVVIVKKNGQVVIGRVGNLSGSSLNVIENMLEPGAMTGVQRAEIASIEPSKVSPMPEGLLNTLKEDEILDLLAYLMSRGDPESALFR
jgi:putative heme-binding domain-containing protein